MIRPEHDASQAPYIVIAPDAFKESCSAAEVAAAIAAGVRRRLPQAHCVQIPIADGGEGTLAAVAAATGGDLHVLTVEDAVGRPCQAPWLALADGTALIELAQAAGLEAVPPAARDPWRTSTYGVGQLLRAALDQGCSHLVLTLGGSATNDAGAGMLQALGVKLLDAAGQDIARGARGLASLVRIDPRGLHPRLREVVVEVAVDVDNPLCGARGATAVYGPQKGLPASEVYAMDAVLADFARRVATVVGHDASASPGAGAAGGTAFAALAFLGASARPGFALVADHVGLARHVAQADLVFVAEGSLDAQTAAGKAPAGVIGLARAAGVPVVALCGALRPGYEALYATGLTAAFSITAAPMSREAAFAATRERLAAVAADVVSLRFGGRPSGGAAGPQS